MPAEHSGCPGVFVTGTDTGVGKTLVSAALALYLRERGLQVGVMKPVETGVVDTAALGPDASLLAWAADSNTGPENLSPVRLREPLAPTMAAEMEGVSIDPGDLLAKAADLAAGKDFLIVEGAGGLMVPLAGGFLMADLARALGLPLLVVARPDLGTINHTLLTLFAARAMEIPLAGYLISGMPPAPSPGLAATPHALASLASADLLGVLEQVGGDDRTKVQALARQVAALPTLSWLLMNLGLGRLVS